MDEISEQERHFWQVYTDICDAIDNLKEIANGNQKLLEELFNLMDAKGNDIVDLLDSISSLYSDLEN